MALRIAPHLPDATVRRLPDSFEMLEQHLLHPPRLVLRLQLGIPRGMQGVHQLAVDVELQLVGSAALPIRTGRLPS